MDRGFAAEPRRSKIVEAPLLVPGAFRHRPQSNGSVRALLSPAMPVTETVFAPFADLGESGRRMPSELRVSRTSCSQPSPTQSSVLSRRHGASSELGS